MYQIKHTRFLLLTLTMLSVAGCGGSSGGGSEQTPAPTIEELAANWVPDTDMVTPQALTGEVTNAYIGIDGFMLLGESLPPDPGDPEQTPRSRNYFGYIEVNNGNISGTLNYTEVSAQGEPPPTGVATVSGVAADNNNLSGVVDFSDGSSLAFALVRGDELEDVPLDVRLTGQWESAMFSLPEYDIALSFDDAGNGVGTFQQVCLFQATAVAIRAVESESVSNPLLTIHQIDVEATGCVEEGDYYGLAVILEIPIGEPPLELLALRLGNAAMTFETTLTRPAD